MLTASTTVRLLIWRAFSADLQLAEHLWTLTNIALVYRHFATIDELDRCNRRSVQMCSGNPL